MLYSIVYFMLQEMHCLLQSFFCCFRWQFATVTVASQRDQPKQVEALVPKFGATSVTKSDTDFVRCKKNKTIVLPMWWLHKLFTEFTEKVFRLFVCFYPNNNIYHKLINYNQQVNTLHNCFFSISVYVPKPKGCSRCSMYEWNIHFR